MFKHPALGALATLAILLALSCAAFPSDAPSKPGEPEAQAAPAVPAPSATPAGPGEKPPAEAPAPAEAPKKPEVALKPYGYVKIDLAWDDSRTSTGNFARWAEDESVNQDDDEFNATINQTRLGLDAKCEVSEFLAASAKIEADLYGLGAAENKSEFMLRHAHVVLDFKKYGLRVLAGQAFDLLSPLNPSTVNYTVLWWNGNIGYRRPQVRVTKTVEAGGVDLLLAAALLRNIGHDFGAWDPGDTGEDSALMAVQWRLAATKELFPKEKLEIGISGHWSQESIDRSATGKPSLWVTSWALSFEVRVPIQPCLSLQLEAWTGENLDQLLGGIGTGVNAALEAVSSSGGWAVLTFKVPGFPAGKLTLNAGLGLDDPVNSDLAAGNRARNFSWLVNAWWEPFPGLQLALELMRLETQYLSRQQAEATRLQAALQFSF